jgi:PAS domain S-box-containing protein
VTCALAALLIATVSTGPSWAAVAPCAGVAVIVLALVARRADTVLASVQRQADERQRLAARQEERARGELGRSNELLLALSRNLAEHIASPDSDAVFDGLLDDLLVLTDSPYGFVAEVMRSSSGTLYAEYRAIRNVAWLADHASGQPRPTYTDLEPLIEQVIQSECALLLDAQGSDRRLPAPWPTFAGLPLVKGQDMVGIVGLGGRPVGYSQELLDFLQPAMASCTTLLLSAKARAAREHTAEQLRESEQRYRDLFENASDLIHSVRPDGSFAYVNRAWLDTLGYTEEEIEQLTIWEVSRPEAHPRYRALLASPDQSLVPPLSEVTFVTRDGRAIPCEGSETCRVVDGVPVATRGMFRDVSTQRRAAEAMRMARDEAEAAARAKSDFLANMSHEIRTPMNAVIGMTGLLLDTPLSGEQREFVETIRNAGDGLLEIINDILDFSKVDSGRLELEAQPFGVHECVEAAADLVARAAAAKGIELVLSIDPALPSHLVGDVTRLRQILVNLLGNAVKFTTVGQVEARVDGTSLGEGRWRLLVQVQDSGIGIPADRVNRLFRAFSQVDSSTTRQYGGTGLGLAISKRLVEQMGGEMWVESREGVGSTFSFTLVAAAADAPRAGDSEGPRVLAGRRVLIVDGNAAVRASLSRQLCAWQATTETAGDLDVALEAIARTPPALVLLDQKLCAAGEASPVARLRAVLGERPPIVLLTTVGQAACRAAAAEPATASVGKPVKRGSLRDAIAGVLGAPGPGTLRPSADRTGALEESSMATNLPLRILVAEDNLVNQKVVLKMLHRLGYGADVVGNGLEAVEAVSRQAYDVLLLDVQMPVMDGFEATVRLRASPPTTHTPRIVGMTALAMTGDRERCLESGMDDYIAKPIRLDELRHALERAAAPPIDAQAIAGLRQLQDADEPDFVTELIDLLLDDAPGRFAAIRDAIATSDAVTVNRTAHALKSSCGNLGARTLAGLLAALEQAGGRANMEEASALLSQACDEFARVRRALLDLRQPSTDAA